MMLTALIVHVNDAIIALCYLVIAALLVSVASRIRSFFMFPHAKGLLRRSLYAVAACAFTGGLTHTLQFTLLFGTHLQVIMIFTIACAATVSLATVYLLSKWKQLSVMAAGGLENQRYNMGEVSHFQDQAAVTMALIGAPDMVSVHAPDNMAFLYMNAACRSFGYSASALRGIPLSSLVHQEDMPMLDAMVQSWNITRTHQDVVKQYRIRTAAHTYVHVESCCHWDELDVSTAICVHLIYAVLNL